jgi:hypothetical protein
MGDGINDAPALHAADVGVSVDQAVDVARETADIVLLERDLDVLTDGVIDGRRTFANTLKYVSITTSANFGNMISMSIATLFVPFLPLLAKQILLNNFLSDFPSVAISTDNVDASIQIEGKKRVFNLAIDSKLRGCDGDPIPLRADTVGGATCVADCRPSMAAIGILRKHSTAANNSLSVMRPATPA